MVDVQGTIPAPLNYAPPGYRPYPKSICTSVNHQVCHGVPGERALKAGDIVNIDVTVIKDGWHGDSSRMYLVDDVSIGARRLCEVTFECMWLGIAAVRPWGSLRRHRRRNPGARGKARIQRGARILRPRNRPALPRGAAGSALWPGLHAGSVRSRMTFTIEPMVNAGRARDPRARRRLDHRTKDHSLSAQWEHTVLVTESGVEVLTRSAGTSPPPAIAAGRLNWTPKPALV